VGVAYAAEMDREGKSEKRLRDEKTKRLERPEGGRRLEG